MVIKVRRKNGIAIGIMGNKRLEMLTRAHGNFTEYTPIFLIMLFLLESNNALKPCFLHILAIAFLLARISHMFSLSFVEKYEDGILKTHVKFRAIGMLTTFLTIFIGAIFLILNSISKLY